MSTDLDHATSPFTISIDDDLSTLRLDGELDDSTASELLDAARFVTSLRGGDLLIDLSAVTFLGAAGLNTLVRIHLLLAERDEVLRVALAPARIARVFTLGTAQWLLEEAVSG